MKMLKWIYTRCYFYFTWVTLYFILELQNIRNDVPKIVDLISIFSAFLQASILFIIIYWIKGGVKQWKNWKRMIKKNI